MTAHDMKPEEVALRRDLDSLAFRAGVGRKKWALARLAFPYAYFRIRAPDRDTGPKHFLLRAEFTGYRGVAPTSALWDGREDAALAEALRPKKVDGTPVIAFTSSCGVCLYHPIDRQARVHWAGKHEDLAWGPASNIITLLECVHALLDTTEYHSSAAPEAAAYLPGRPMDEAA